MNNRKLVLFLLLWCNVIHYHALNANTKKSPNNKTTSSLQEKIRRIYNSTIYRDSPRYQNVGFDNCNMHVNGELATISRFILPRDIVFDVGANKGDWSKIILNKFRNTAIKLYAFEPMPATFEQLKKELENFDLSLNKLALSDKKGTKTFFHYPGHSTLSSFYERPILNQNFNSKPIKVNVKTCDLDSFCQKENIPSIDFLKIDTEGAELDVLRGAATMLRENKIRIVQFEYGGTYKDANIQLKQAYELLTNYNYTLFRISKDGLIHLPKWHPELENYRYSNHLAIAPELLPKPIENSPHYRSI